VNSELPCVPVSERVLEQNLSYENKFDLHGNERIGETHLHMHGFAQKLVLTMKAIEHYFHVVTFIMLYKVVLTFELVDETLACDHERW